MKKHTLCLVLALAFGWIAIGAAFAQEQPAKPTITDYEKAVPVIVNQRNQLSTALLDAQTQLQLLATENAELKKQVAELSAKLAEVEKPKAASAPLPSDKNLKGETKLLNMKAAP